MGSAIILTIFSLCGLFSSVSSTNATIDISISNKFVTVGDNVTLTCNITNPTREKFLLLWLRQTPAHKMEIAANSFLNDKFKRTGRYTATYTNMAADLSYVTFILRISDLQSSDSGVIGCQIAQSSVEAFTDLIVQVPISSVTWMGPASNESRPLEINSTMVLHEDELMTLSCIVNGSYPAPVVTIMAGDSDVTTDFERSIDLVRVGEVAGLEEMYYRLTLTATTLRMKYAFHENDMKCIAMLPSSNFPAVSSSFEVSLPGYKPKFVCNNTLIRQMHANNVKISCTVHANPPPTHFEFYWKKFNSHQFARLTPGFADGHYTATLVNGKTTNEKTMVLDIDRLYTQAFREYQFLAHNQYGNETISIHLRQESPYVQTNESVLIRISSFVMVSFCFLFTCM